MPILKYTCEDCGKEFAKIIVNEDHIPKNCPVCDSQVLVEHGAAFHADMDQTQRALCMSCDSCGEEQSCGV